MLTLSRPPESSFELDGQEIRLNLAYDNVLRLFELFEDDMFNAYEKISTALKMLIIDHEEIMQLEFEYQLELFYFIQKEFLDPEKQTDEDQPKKKIMDWKKDAGMIYASFLSEYQIDLFKVQGQLQWSQFMALLTNLSDSTAFKKAVGYRTMKVPSGKQATEEYRNHVIKMKQLHSLEDPEEKQETLENTLDAVASTFAKGGGKQ
jgi:hypothetical protein